MVTERTNWIKTRNKLNSNQYDENWETVFSIFNDRINDKFFSSIELLIDNGNKSGNGFSILSLECLLIELFATFKSGEIHNARYDEKSDPSYQFKDSSRVYTEFLYNCSIFENHFYKIDESEGKILNTPFNAMDFYTDVRCGLLHEGKTKKKWTINLKPKGENNDIFIKETGSKIKVYRTVLYMKLKKYLAQYLDELRGENNESKILRNNFARKMDNLYGFKPNKKKFNWWNEK